MPDGPSFDRRTEDIGNIVQLEHVNLSHDDQARAVLFYLLGLGLTRDPYMAVGLDNMWVNIGRSQLHLPSRGPQVLRGRVGLVMPDIAALQQRLAAVAPQLEGTAFAVATNGEGIDVTCPWGNRFRIHAPDPARSGLTLALTYVQFDVPLGTAAGIARFYQQVLRARVTHNTLEDAPAAIVTVGPHQRLIFRESAAPLPDYDGHHVQIYVADFSGPYTALAERGLISAENGQHQYRFVTLFDPDDGRALYALEHEVRSLTHPLRGRELLNRDPAQTMAAYAANGDRSIARY